MHRRALFRRLAGGAVAAIAAPALPSAPPHRVRPWWTQVTLGRGVLVGAAGGDLEIGIGPAGAEQVIADGEWIPAGTQIAVRLKRGRGR